jgi:hypothetical protein
MNKPKKKAEPAPVRPDVVILCTRCPSHMQVRDDTTGNGTLYAPRFQCDVCGHHFASDAPVLVAGSEATTELLKDRADKIVAYRLELANKALEKKDREIERLKTVVESYERAMAFMGGMPKGRTIFGIPY